MTYDQWSVLLASPSVLAALLGLVVVIGSAILLLTDL